MKKIFSILAVAVIVFLLCFYVIFPSINVKNFSIENYIKTTQYREPSGLDYKNKKSIIIFGCGYAEGLGLNDNRTFAAQLSDYMKRPVYNRGKGGDYIQHAIIQVQSHQLDDIIKNSEYVIYVLPVIKDSFRLSVYPGPYFDKYFIYNKYLYPKFILNKDNELQLYTTKHTFIEGHPAYRIFNKYLVEKIKKDTTPSIEENTLIHFDKLNKELKKINPNIKLVVLVYWDLYNGYPVLFKNMEEKGIKLISVSDLTKENLNDSKYRSDIGHPTEEAWKLLVPYIAKELKQK